MTTAKVKAAPAAQTAAPANDAAKTIEQAVAAGKETMEQVVKASQDAATKGYEKAVAMTKEQVAAAVKAQEDSVASAKENVEALVKANQLLAQGLQEIAKTLIALTQENVEETVAASKQMMAAKTMRELVDLQTSLAKAQFDRMVAESQRLSDMGTKLFEEAFAPLTARVNAQVDKLVKAAA